MFVTVEKNLYDEKIVSDLPFAKHLNGTTLKTLLDYEYNSTAYSLTTLDRTNYTVALSEITEESISKLSESFMGKILEWNLNGGSVTLEKFKELSPEKRKELFDYICDFSLIETVDVKDRAFVLVHSTLGNFSKVKKLRQYTPFELTSIRADYDKQLFDDPDIYVVSGHTPTPMINGKAEIYYSHNNIDIDCGATYGGKLACLRLDDMQEFYV